MYIAWGVAIAQLFLNPKRKLQNKLSLKPGDGELEAEHTTEEESEEWEEEKKVQKGEEPLEVLASSRPVSPWPVSPRPVSPRLFESSDTPDTTREESDTTGGNTEGTEIIGQ
ncbi:hypothetical protein Glove_243g34 [Diversispora epigaea]|uniref:Uncharacterized protein n=1 Tax=Diversispora epigaea TaxID=1348612 RepID=A0A397IH14_9GLOM|nr:hypothetical protein Glove_243g33 [Diversispora epigaea]RHZ72323.1 hypothetical protein Glove_243g34 [Diversispora epigaea]